MKILKIQKLSKVFNPNTVNENKVFEEFSLNIEEGEYVSIIGSNGAGKSTLLNLINGSIPMDKGKIYLDGIDVSKAEDYKRAKDIGMVYQDPSVGVAPNMTILENISLADNKGKSFNLSFGINKKRINYYKEILSEAKLGLEDKMYNKAKLLSGGQRQALTLIMAVMSKPKILLLDEHTAALDPKTAIRITEITNEIIKEKNITTLMVTHNLKYALESGNRLLMMHAGKIIIDVKGQKKKELTIEKLMDFFENNQLMDILSDRSLLYKEG